ncbi:TauD/TfdA family dioxygenase [Pseudofrankia inefficax]|uniref:Gamma-butyrobetaine dioxygenase n=1 Tax=Pseudofrankia inefficax (strain DSM 45817 / CECT 9037 / DDB 130130 / EuI1c) TaxID=298654 RepID=E3JCG8_PSEI1|nr:TauD/TfdA family dioxygenase [Pseudofrankia inefficax]ADP78664.1 Gamma-butyrobetaine dioxygenase [Pseudofrankia inefficax]
MNAAGPVTMLHLGDLALPAIWLRDACGCAECRYPATGQRLVGSARVARLYPDLAVERHAARDGRLTVVFAPDGHESVFELAWLEQHAPGRGARLGDQSAQARVAWTATDLPVGPPRVAWDAYLRSPVAMATALGAVEKLGAAVITEVPARPGMVLTVGRSLGHVRVTNYGELFDVRVEPDPEHLAYTGLALAPHTDNPYRDPVPTVQLLHCLRAAGAGGDTTLVDGFAAADRLRETDRAAFDTLTQVWLPFSYDGPTSVLTCRAPVISVDDEGAVTQVRWNDRGLQPPDVAPDRIGAVYRALAAFGEVLDEADLAVSLRLVPGDCLIFDNTRVLHGRSAYGPTATGEPGSGGRHLQGCYVDMDGLRSTLEVLRRDGTRAVPTQAGPAGRGRAPRVVATRASARPIAAAR